MEVLSVCAAGMQPHFEDGLQGQEVVTHSLQVDGRAQEPGVLCGGRPTVTRWMLLRQFTAAGTTSVKEEALRARLGPRLFRALKGGSPQQHLRLELSQQPVQLPQDRTGSLPGGPLRSPAAEFWAACPFWSTFRAGTQTGHCSSLGGRRLWEDSLWLGQNGTERKTVGGLGTKREMSSLPLLIPACVCVCGGGQGSSQTPRINRVH